MVPPGSLIPSVAAIRSTVPLALIRLVMVIDGAVRVTFHRSTGPATVRPSASVRMKSPVATEKPPNVAIEFVAAKLAVAPEAPSSVPAPPAPTVSTVPAASVTDDPLSTSSTSTPDRFTTLLMVIGPAAGEPSTKVFAVNGSAPDTPASANGAPAVNGASAIVPAGALSAPPPRRS